MAVTPGIHLVLSFVPLRGWLKKKKWERKMWSLPFDLGSFRPLRIIRRAASCIVCPCDRSLYHVENRLFAVREITCSTFLCHTVLFTSSFPPPFLLFPDQENIRGHSDHHPGHGNHWRLRRIRVLPPQSIHRVSQVDCVGDVPQQTQHC